MRKGEINRTTAETNIALSIELDGTGKSEISTGCGFLDHMLTLFASHGRFDLSIGICLGKAFAEAIGNCKGIKRYGNMMLPMDESLVLCALDVSGRAYLNYGLDIKAEKIGDFDTELIEEFFLAFVRNANITLHIKQLDGKNAHHIAEAGFKAFARALRQAVEIDEKAQNEIPSTKGVL